MSELFKNWLKGWADSWNKTMQYGRYEIPGDNFIVEILLIAALVGAILNIAGVHKTGNKLLFGSIIGGLIWMVIICV